MQFVPRLCEGRAACSWIYGSLCGFMYIIPHCYIPLFWWRWVWYLNIGALFRRIIMFGWPRRLVDISYEDCWFPIRKCHESQEFLFWWMLMKNVDPFSFPSCLWESKMLIWEPKWKLVTVCPSPTLRRQVGLLMPPRHIMAGMCTFYSHLCHCFLPRRYCNSHPCRLPKDPQIRKQKEASATHLAWHSQNNQTSWDPVNLSQKKQNSPHPGIQLMFIVHARNISCIVTGACLGPQSLPKV